MEKHTWSLSGIVLGAAGGRRNYKEDAQGLGSDVCPSLSYPPPQPPRLSRQDLEAREDAGYASLELPGDCSLSLPTLDLEETSDELISPYASFSSTADRPMPLLSAWLDKLSPQGCGSWGGKGCWEAGKW